MLYLKNLIGLFYINDEVLVNIFLKELWCLFLIILVIMLCFGIG